MYKKKRSNRCVKLSFKTSKVIPWFRANERIIVKELAERYDSTINVPFNWPRYKGEQTYMVGSILLVMVSVIDIYSSYYALRCTRLYLL